MFRYADYTILRDSSPPRRFTVLNKGGRREEEQGGRGEEQGVRREEQGGRGEEVEIGELASLDFTYDINGDIVSTSSLDKSSSRREKRSRSPYNIRIVLYSVNALYILVDIGTEYRVRFAQSAVIFV